MSLLARPVRTLVVLGALALVVTLVARRSRLLDDAGDDRPAAAATVVRVVDGDTLVVDRSGAGERVRLIGIDTPESVAPDRPVECYGAEAAQRLGELVPAGTAVRLVRDIEPRDAYDRLLAYVYRADDDLFLNASLVESGHAEASAYPPNTARRDRLDAAEQVARTTGTGLWGTCGARTSRSLPRPMPPVRARAPAARSGRQDGAGNLLRDGHARGTPGVSP